MKPRGAVTFSEKDGRMNREETVWEQLDAARVDDAVIGEAYEAAGARPRSLLKTCIAQAHAAFGHALPFQESESSVAYPGVVLRRSVRPADWCLVLLEAVRGKSPRALDKRTGMEPQRARVEKETRDRQVKFEEESSRIGAEKRDAGSENADTPEMLAARHAVLAVLSAVFSGVSEIWVVIVEREDLTSERALAARSRAVDDLVYAGLELAGIENVCLLPEKKLLDILPRLAAEGPGRILVMGDPCWKLEALRCCSARNGIMVWCEGREPGDESDSRQRFLWPVLPPSFFREERIECREL